MVLCEWPAVYLNRPSITLKLTRKAHAQLGEILPDPDSAPVVIRIAPL